MDEPDTPSALEAALRAAAKSYLAARKAAEAERSGRAELLAVMARLSLPPAELDRLRDAASASELPVDLRSRLAERIAREERRLLRLGRAGHPRYELSRHIAVRRAAKWLSGRPVTGTAEDFPFASGSELNRRFKRRNRAIPALRLAPGRRGRAPSLADR